jgi:hypothetical protein
MFETLYGWSPERTASSARVRSSPRSMSPCHSRASARSRTISGTSGGFGGFGGARSGLFAGFETTSLRFLLPSPLGRQETGTPNAKTASVQAERLHEKRRPNTMKSTLDIANDERCVDPKDAISSALERTIAVGVSAPALAVIRHQPQSRGAAWEPRSPR